MTEATEAVTPSRRKPKVLTLDIETAPATALVFGQWKQDISNVQIVKPDRVIGIGAKWLHEPKPMWRSEYHHGKEVMVHWVHGLLSEADIVVHFNGGSFDMPWIDRAITELDLPDRPPVKEIDMLKVVRKRSRLMSNKLEAVLAFYGLDPKLSHTGFKMWRDIELGRMTCPCHPDYEQIQAQARKAWALMRRYCKQDVVSEEQLYLRLRRYIPNHPHVGLYTGDDSILDCCENCGAGLDQLQRRGYATTRRGKYPRYQCLACGKWSQDKKAIGFVDLRGVS